MDIDFKMPDQIPVSKIKHPVLQSHDIDLDLLRLDQLHPLISGNKWFKLKYNIEAALKDNKQILLSFGGAFSNHLHALAYAGKMTGMSTIGIVRGEEVMNATLNDCRQCGMQLHFISRAQYRQKEEDNFLIDLRQKYPGAFFIPEGGENEAGLEGCKHILDNVDIAQYHIVACSVGTGTTLSGIIRSSQIQNHFMGFAAVKGGEYLREEISKNTRHQNWQLITDYHFGGFARKSESLIKFMKEFYLENQIELDFIYTAKMMFGLLDLISSKKISMGTKILAIHTGGLQGNRSLSAGLFWDKF